jgi:hypothetical protein
MKAPKPTKKGGEQMDKDAALLIVTKDLFIEAWKTVPGLYKQPNHQKTEPGIMFPELEVVVDQYIAFHESVRSKINK